MQNAEAGGAAGFGRSAPFASRSPRLATPPRVDAVRYRLPAPLHAHFCIGKDWGLEGLLPGG